METPIYTHPETGEELPLDEVQKELYREFVAFGVPPESAATIAYYTDAEEPDRRIINWSKIFYGVYEASGLAGVSKSYMTTLARYVDRPDMWPSIESPMGLKQTWRMWSIGRCRWLKSRAA